MTYAPLCLGVAAFLFCLIVTPLCRELFVRMDIVDRPDGARKFHSRAVPRIGGIAIVVSYAAALMVMVVCAPQGAETYLRHRALFWSTLPAATLIFLTGLLDDIFTLQPWQKIAGQLAASSLAVALGARVHLFTGSPIQNWATLIASVIWLVSCTNASNLIDGLDGLATGVGLFAAGAVIFAALLQGNMGLVMATLPLAACLLAFLRYNFAPASVFLGDCGSMTIGFLLGCFSLVWSQHATNPYAIFAPVMAMAVPLIDVVVSITRRLLSSHPVFKADRGHIHYKLLTKGLTPRGVVLVLYAACALASALALLQTSITYRLRALPLLLFFSLVIFGIHKLGYAEFRLARKICSRKLFLTYLREELYLHDLKSSLESAETLEQCWTVVSSACTHLHFDSVSMCLHGRVFEQSKETLLTNYAWEFTISLGDAGYLRLARVAECDTPRLMMAALHSVQQTLEAKSLGLMHPAGHLDHLDHAGEPANSMAMQDSGILA